MGVAIERMEDRVFYSPLSQNYKGSVGGDCTSEPCNFKTNIHDAADSPTESGTYFVCTSWVINGKMRDYQWSAADYTNKKWMVDKGELVVAWMERPPIPSASLTLSYEDA